MNPRQLAVLALAFNAFAFGLSWWPFRWLQGQGVHVLWATALAYALAVMVLRSRGMRALAALREHPQLWGLFVASGLTNVCFNWGVTVGDVVRVVLCFYLMPLWATLLGWLWLGERPHGRAVLQLLLALCGVLLVLWPDARGAAWHLGFSEALGLAGGFCFAFTNVQLRRLSHLPSAARSAAMFSGGGWCSAVLAAGLMASGSAGVAGLPAISAPWVLGVLGLGVWVLLANLALQYGAARLSARTTALVLLVEVVFAAASSAALGAAQITPLVALGAALVVSAAALSSAEAH